MTEEEIRRGSLARLFEENSEIIRRRPAGEASEEEVEEFKLRFLRQYGVILFWCALVASGVLAVLHGISWSPARLLKGLEQWHLLTEFFGWFALGGMAVYLSYQANRIAHQQTELSRRQTELLDRQQKAAEEQLRPRLRLRCGVDRHGGEVGDVSRYSIENVGGEVEKLFVMAGSALVATLCRTTDAELETLAFPVGFYVRPRYTQESKGVVYESQALGWNYKEKRWVSMNDQLSAMRKALDQRFGERGGFCRVNLRHFVSVFAEGAFGGIDSAVFEVPEYFTEMEYGPSRLPYKEGDATLTAITSSLCV